MVEPGFEALRVVKGIKYEETACPKCTSILSPLRTRDIVKPYLKTRELKSRRYRALSIEEVKKISLGLNLV